MKLNYRKTLCVGFAFPDKRLLMAYDTVIPKILTDKFGLPQTWSGVVMALDNILALLYCRFSARVRAQTPVRRTPYILIGTIVAAVLFVGLSFIDNLQLTKLDAVSDVEAKSTLEFLYDYDYKTKLADGVEYELATPSGDKYILTGKFTREQFTSITLKTDKIDPRTGEVVLNSDGSPKQVINPLYLNYVIPARGAYAWDQTVSNPATLIFFMLLLLFVLVSMATSARRPSRSCQT